MQNSTLEHLDAACAMVSHAASLVRRDEAAAIGTGDHVEVIRHYNQVRLAADRIKEAREALKDMEERLSRETVPQFMRDAGVKTITVEGVGRVTVSNKFSCSITDKPRGYDYLRDTGNGSLIQETVNSSTLAAFAKNKLETEGIELPPDIFKTSIMSYTSITKAK